MKLELAQSVALGAFNPYIIVPPWLVKTRILPEGEAQVLLRSISEGGAFRLGGTEWEVDHHHLAVSSLERDCGEIVAAVLGELPHTPVRAVGHNFHFSCPRDEWVGPQPVLGGRGWDELTKFAPLKQLRWTGVFLREGATVEMTLAHSEDQVLVLVNYHRDTNNDPENSISAAKRFAADKEDATMFLSQLIGQEARP